MAQQEKRKSKNAGKKRKKPAQMKYVAQKRAQRNKARRIAANILRRKGLPKSPKARAPIVRNALKNQKGEKGAIVSELVENLVL